MVRLQVSVGCYAPARSENTLATLHGEEPWLRARYPTRPKHCFARASMASSTQEGIYLCKSNCFACTTRSHLTSSYLIPGKNGSLKSGERLLNYVWYCNYVANSPELRNLMTDTEGHYHRVTMPMGKIRPEVCARQMVCADRILPTAFAEVVRSINSRSYSVLTDASAPQAVFFGVGPPVFTHTALDLGHWRLQH